WRERLPRTAAPGTSPGSSTGSSRPACARTARETTSNGLPRNFDSGSPRVLAGPGMAEWEEPRHPGPVRTVAHFNPLCPTMQHPACSFSHFGPFRGESEGKVLLLAVELTARRILCPPAPADPSD